MTEALQPLKPGDEVFIRELKMYGKVLEPHQGTANEPEEERLYSVQITRYFQRTDLELYDGEAERKKREATRRENMDRLTAVSHRVEQFVAAGGDINSLEGSSLGVELLKASNAIWVDLGHNPFLVPINPSK